MKANIDFVLEITRRIHAKECELNRYQEQKKGPSLPPCESCGHDNNDLLILRIEHCKNMINTYTETLELYLNQL